MCVCVCVPDGARLPQQHTTHLWRWRIGAANLIDTEEDEKFVLVVPLQVRIDHYGKKKKRVDEAWRADSKDEIANEAAAAALRNTQADPSFLGNDHDWKRVSTWLNNHRHANKEEAAVPNLAQLHKWHEEGRCRFRSHIIAHIIASLILGDVGQLILKIS